MRLPETLLVATLVLLAGCGAGAPEPEPTVTPGNTVDTETPADTPTATRTCHTVTPVPNPDEITHHIAVSNDFGEPRNVTAVLAGDERIETRSKTVEGSWNPYVVTEPGTYTVRIEVNGTERVNRTIEPPYIDYPTLGGSSTFVTLEQNGSVTVHTLRAGVGPPVTCSR